MVRLEFAPEIYSLAEYPHVEITAKAVGLPKEKVAFLEFSKAALMTSLFAATDKSHHQMLTYKLANEDGSRAIDDILRIIAVSIKNVGEITAKDFEMIYSELGVFESVPTFNRNKCMYLFVRLLGEKGFRVVEDKIEGIISKEELKEVVREVIREELPSLLRTAEKLTAYVK